MTRLSALLPQFFFLKLHFPFRLAKLQSYIFVKVLPDLSLISRFRLHFSSISSLFPYFLNSTELSPFSNPTLFLYTHLGRLQALLQTPCLLLKYLNISQIFIHKVSCSLTLKFFELNFKISKFSQSLFEQVLEFFCLEMIDFRDAIFLIYDFIIQDSWLLVPVAHLWNIYICII